MIKRYQDWEDKFSQFIAKTMHRPFVWGRNDCCIYAANAVKAITGVDFAGGCRGKYRKEEDAIKLIDELGGIEKIVDNCLGALQNKNFVQRGDVVMYSVIEKDNSLALGVCIGNGFAAPSKKGLIIYPLDRIIKAWRV